MQYINLLLELLFFFLMKYLGEIEIMNTLNKKL